MVIWREITEYYVELYHFLSISVLMSLKKGKPNYFDNQVILVSTDITNHSLSLLFTFSNLNGYL